MKEWNAERMKEWKTKTEKYPSKTTATITITFLNQGLLLHETIDWSLRLLARTANSTHLFLSTPLCFTCSLHGLAHSLSSLSFGIVEMYEYVLWLFKTRLTPMDITMKDVTMAKKNEKKKTVIFEMLPHTHFLECFQIYFRWY